MKKHYVVTGGAGFIASHIVDLVISEGHSVLILDNLETGRRENLNPAADFVEFDLRQPEGLTKLLKGAAGVFHAAALPRIQPTFVDPIGHDEANVRATLHLLTAMRESGVRKIVNSGSSACYGTPDILPTPESSPISPLSPYALQKYASEAYCMTLSERWDIRCTGLRYFNVYGPRSFNPKNPLNAYTSVIGIFVHAKAAGESLKITGDGTQERDFVHVYDVARANYLGMLYNGPSEPFNVGAGKCYTINDVARRFETKIEYIPARPGEARITWADTTNITRKLGWSPQVELDDAIARGIA
jgi:UDP-glucose 4-epimerase